MKKEELLFDAVKAGDVQSLIVLLKQEVDINSLEMGYSLLHTSISSGANQISTILIKNFINVNIKDQKGQTALHYCAFYNNTVLALELINNSGNLSIADIYGNEPLWTAVFNDYGENERREMIELFIKNGADIKHQNNAGKSPYDIVLARPFKNLFDLFKIE